MVRGFSPITEKKCKLYDKDLNFVEHQLYHLHLSFQK